MSPIEFSRRIKLDNILGMDYDSLKSIQNGSMLSIPFENLDIIGGRRIEIEQEPIYKKLVEGKRGGYCYELNGLLAWYLEATGYDVTKIGARVRNENGTYGPDNDHMILLVRLEQEYIVDAGFGDSAREPLPMAGQTASDVSGNYRIARTEDNEFHLEREQNEGWTTQYKFSLTPQSTGDFHEANIYQQTSFDSHFKDRIFCSIATPEGRLTISGRKLVRTVGRKKETAILQTLREFEDALEEGFNFNSEVREITRLPKFRDVFEKSKHQQSGP